ncbi:MAG: SOS response-associated peptidase, partial [Candidatus Marinimicrobia bacterium]|nr:SOS response-associated peptidase [Candidatus Neomarinimicrobiota bacterium]
RKTLTRDMQSIIEEMAIEEWQDSDLYSPSFNIAPTQTSPVMIDRMGRRVKHMQWGLIPNWAKDESISSKLINARAETLLQKPSFQNLVPRKRCVVISDGYYEWKRTSSKSIPYYIHHRENKLLPMAGLWDTWKNLSDESIFSYTVITTTSSPGIEDIHHRMPVILKQDNINPWLQVHNTSIPDAMDLLVPYSGPLNSFQVSTMVNSPKNNRKECIVPIGDSDSLSLF